MGSVTTPAVPPGSLDRFGLSITTAARSGVDPRAGSLYDPMRLAAAVPVHFHPIDGQTYLGLFDGYWHNATPAADAVGMYAAHTAVARPCAVMFDAGTGRSWMPFGQTSWELPLRSTFSAVRLWSAASAGTFLFTLMTADDVALLCHWRLTTDGQIALLHEYPLPDIAGVRYDRGVYLDGPYLYLWGADGDNVVHTARAHTSKLGGPWSYQTDDGWAPTGGTPVPGLFSAGPMSTLVHRRRTLVTTVDVVGGDVLGQVWGSASMGQSWTLHRQTLIDDPLLWTGNGLMMQPQASVNPDALPEGASAGVPMVSTAHPVDVIEGEGEDPVEHAGLLVSWDLLPITPAMT